ncbi:MAG: hypothetical protein ABJD07_04310 [Gemmatimonadaceae bacterium]
MRVRALHPLILLAALVLAPVAAAPLASLRAATIDKRVRESDPAGSYTYSLDVEDGKVTGTLVITHPATGYAAVITSSRTQGELKARSVEVTGDHAVLIFDTEFGTFTVDMTTANAAIAATWKLATTDGSQGGTMELQKVKP